MILKENLENRNTFENEEDLNLSSSVVVNSCFPSNLTFGKNRIVVTFGTFDLFHVGHLNILLRAARYGTLLYVGVSTDRLNYEKKQRFPVVNQECRKAIIESIRGVSGVFDEDSLELKRKYLQDLQADVLVMGDDWKGKFDELGDIVEVVYLPRTPFISTTQLIEDIKQRKKKNEENESENDSDFSRGF